MNGYHSTTPKRRGHQIKIVLKSIARPKKTTPDAQHSARMADKKTASPLMTFASGPGFESRELEIDLRDLVSVNVNDLDDSLKDIIIGRQQRNSRPNSIATDDNDDTASIVSELSTCSGSVVAVVLEPVDELEAYPSATPRGFMSKGRKKSPKPPPSPTSPRHAEHMPNYPSSSEAEDEESRKNSLGRKSKKISNLFSFSSSSSSNQNLAFSDNYQIDKAATPERKRRGSVTRKSPLNFGGIFNSSGMSSAGSNQSIAGSKQDLAESSGSSTGSKDVKTQGPPPKPPPKPNRKLSLGMFQKPTNSSPQEMRQRRNTDPTLPPSAIQEARESNTELKVEGDDSGAERVRKVSFSTLAPKIQEPDAPSKGTLCTTVEPEEAFFKVDDIKLRDLMEDILRAHMLSMRDYRKETCDRTGRSICKVIKTLVEAMKDAEGLDTKVVCLVYIAAVRDSGVYMSTQALWDSDQDNFAAASFRNDSVFGLATVIVTPVQ